ncbi:hypothetical protein VTP01DRAFT_4519 [Rhizomucor pusillus]|uniref:uncharacterized protein n=1 Tax=Rhizomucor pusillus TaxID=4840 RepID=UPI00374453D6
MSTTFTDDPPEHDENPLPKSDSDNEFEDFRPPPNVGLKRRRTEEEEEEERATECPICLCVCASSGPHRIVSLKCGHLLGESCLLQWFKEKKSKTVTCPKCNDTVRKQDIRPLYTSHVIAQDTSLIEDLKRQIEDLKSENLKLLKDYKSTEMALNMSKRFLQEVSEENKQLVNQLKAAGLYKTLDSEAAEKKEFKEAFTLRLPNGLKGRNIAVNEREEMLLLSAGSASHGHGLQRLSLRDFETSDFFKIHEHQIRDVKVSMHNSELVLSTSFDKTLCLSSITDKYIFQTYILERPGWSCSFDPRNPSLLHCGQANNTICIFDIRNTNTHVQCLQAKDTRFPIHSMQIFYTASGQKEILYSTPVGSYVWKLMDGQEPELRPLPQLENGFKPYSLMYDEQSNSLLISSRRSEIGTYPASTKHSIYHINELDYDRPCWSFENCNPQIPLARTHLYRDDDDIVVCFSDDKDKKINLRNANGNIQSIDVEDSILDIKTARIGSITYLAGLSESRFYLYQHK